MATETSKRKAARLAEGWFDKYCKGSGIDIGCGPDPVTPDCRKWDILDGDAQWMSGVPDESYDWVYSSHCLEHVNDPSITLSNWWRILKPGGYLIVMVPDEDLYEQGLWPPYFNSDHKSTWTISKPASWSEASRNLKDEFEKLPGASIISMKLYDTNYDIKLQRKCTAAVVIESIDLARKIEQARSLHAGDMLQHQPTMRCLGFYPIDQTAAPMNAEVSIEGIAQKSV